MICIPAKLLHTKLTLVIHYVSSREEHAQTQQVIPTHPLGPAITTKKKLALLGNLNFLMMMIFAVLLSRQRRNTPT